MSEAEERLDHAFRYWPAFDEFNESAADWAAVKVELDRLRKENEARETKYQKLWDFWDQNYEGGRRWKSGKNDLNT